MFPIPTWADRRESDGPSIEETRMKRVTLGSATAWSRDRFEPAHDLLTIGNVKYLCFDAMSEVTMSAAQVSKLENPNSPGYDPYLERRVAPILRECKERGAKI